MAIMIPDVPRDYNPASLEGVMFDALKKLPPDYYVVHSFKNVYVEGNMLHEGDADFVGPVFGEGSEPYTEIICGEGRCRYVIHEAEEDGEKYFMGIGQIICQNGLYLMTLCFNNEEDKPWAEEVFSRIKGKKQEKVEEMTYPEEKKPEILN